MGAHINKDGLFQSDKYPTCPAGKVPLSVKDPTAQDLLWEYARRRRSVDAEFSSDLERCLLDAGFENAPRGSQLARVIRERDEALKSLEEMANEFTRVVQEQELRAVKDRVEPSRAHLIAALEAALIVIENETESPQASAAEYLICAVLGKPVRP